MPTPTPPPGSPPPPSGKRGFHLPQRQPWARQHERKSHEEALNAFGEYALFVLMWDIQDHEAGRVERCPRCSSIGGTTTTNAGVIFETFKAPVEDRCPVCFGTTFEGGWKAKLIRPSLWDYTEEKWDKTARGYVTNNVGSVQSTADFFMTDGDYAFRADGTRWQVTGAQNSRIVDGFGHPSRADNNLGINYSNAVREDPSAVAYTIPPTTRTELTAMLDRVAKHQPLDYRSFDQIRGPILPEVGDFTPAAYGPIDYVPGTPDGSA